MWKKYNELTERERASVAAMFSADTLFPDVTVRRSEFYYWCDDNGVLCRKRPSDVMSWKSPFWFEPAARFTDEP